jgi:hypothetical protein
MRAISLASEPLTVSYALRQLVETGELAVFNTGDKAAVLIPLEKYQALVEVLRWLEAPPEAAGKPRKKRGGIKTTRPTRAPRRKTVAKPKAAEAVALPMMDIPSLF